MYAKKCGGLSYVVVASLFGAGTSGARTAADKALRIVLQAEELSSGREIQEREREVVVGFRGKVQQQL